VLCLLDGWLDNAAEIAAELGADRDALPEPLLASAYRRWGRGLPQRMRGDFVVVLWDREREEGLIARDQLGVRPLYLHDGGGVLRFAGEISWLLETLSRRPSPDPAAVAHWIAISRRPGNGTLYEGVRRLGPGEALHLDRHGAKPRRYWQPSFEEPFAGSAEELAVEVREGLERAVRRRTPAGGPTGVLMSGGLDSSAVAAVGAGLREGGVRAFSATFPEHPAADEAELIGALREDLGLSGALAEVLPGGLVESAAEHLAACGMPLVGWGDFWFLPLLRAARAEGVGTMLDGDGGDELFGPRQYLIADRLRAGRPCAALAVAGELPGAGPHVPRRQVAAVVRSFGLVGALPHGLHGLATARLARRAAPSWLRRRALRDLIDSDDPAAWKRLDGPRWWAEPAHALAYGMDEAGVFEHQRRRSALAGLDARHPLLDFDLVRLGLRQPPRATLDRRFNRPVLRAALAGLLPDAVRLRPQKARFDPLIVSCLQGPDAAAVSALLRDPGSELGAYVERERMEEELFGTGGLAQRDPFRWMWLVWRLLTAELWLRAQASPPASQPEKMASHAQVSIDTNLPPTFSHLDRAG
jgi:asparagine synthase (glutamine-hydrolysing)